MDINHTGKYLEKDVNKGIYLIDLKKETKKLHIRKESMHL